MMGLIDPPGRVLSGEVIVGEYDLLTLDEESLRRVRGTRVAMILQAPKMTLTPVLRVDTQMVEAVPSHEMVTRKEALRRRSDERRVGKEWIRRCRYRGSEYAQQK